MRESGIAFEPPGAGVAAADPLDRISLRDHVRAVEVGAFPSERGVEQRLRFDVVLELASPPAALEDDVDRVVSYEIIIGAIDAALAAGRASLVETLAERVAAGCLEAPRVVRAAVRIEKLDRVPGALGVEIVRSRLAATPTPHAAAGAGAGRSPRAVVAYLPPDLLAGPDAALWLAALAARPGPLALALGPERPEPAAGSEGALRAGLLAIDAAAWRLADRDPGLVVVAARAEIDWALGSGRRAVWAPSKLLLDALPRPALDASRPEALAAWLAGVIGAEALILAGAAAPGSAPASPPAGVALRRAALPADLAI